MLAERLKELRMQTGETQRAVAQKTGITEETVSRLENNRNRNPGIEIIKALAVHYKVSASDLLGW